MAVARLDEEAGVVAAGEVASVVRRGVAEEVSEEDASVVRVAAGCSCDCSLLPHAAALWMQLLACEPRIGS